jgi:hypothetical protein
MSRVCLLIVLLSIVRVAAGADAEPLRRLRGSMAEHLAELPVTGLAAPDLRLGHVMVVLGLRDRPALDALLATLHDPRTPRFRRWLDASEIADRFAPRREEYERVRAFLTSHGLEVVRDSAFRFAIAVAGTAAEIEAAFATPIALYHAGGRLHRGPLVEPALPASVAASVRGVVGLDDLPRFRPLLQLTGGGFGLAPRDFALAYGVLPLAARGLTGRGTQIAVIARSNYDDQDVLRFRERFLARGNAPGKRFAGADPGVLTAPGEETEVLLDVQWAGAAAPDAAVVSVIGSRDGDVPEALAVAVEERIGDVVSISFGLCELAAPRATIDVMAEVFDSLYALASAQGQTVLVSAGNNGATDCGRGDARAAVNALASSPYALAVGGTNLALGADGNGDAISYLGETVWNDSHGAGGGGESRIFARPPSQLGLVAPAGPGRLVPDLALAASPIGPGYVIVRRGVEVGSIGGTSAATPALAGLVALANERRGGSGLGALGPPLYRFGSEQERGLRAPVFRDLVTGDNGFAAGPGFDLATGWGSPLAEPLVEALAGSAGGPCEPLLDCLVPGPGPARQACRGQWLIEHRALRRSSRGIPRATQRCADGDPDCDLDGTRDGRCVVNVAFCLNVVDARRRDERGVPRCETTAVRGVRLRSPSARSRLPELADARQRLLASLALLPAPPSDLRTACTATVPLAIPLRSGGRPRRVNLRAGVRQRDGESVHAVTLTCTPA